MKKKQKTKRYIVIVFDGTTTKAVTFRSPANALYFEGPIKGLRSTEAKLHPNDRYDQDKGIRIALERLGFDVSDNPFAALIKKAIGATSNTARDASRDAVRESK